MKSPQDIVLTGDTSDREAGHPPDWRPAWAALLVGAVYYVGAKVGLALTFEPYPISVLWPPNAILLAALLLAPVRWWWVLLLGAFPAHLVAELQGGVPTAMVLCWFVSNVSEALIGAIFVRHFVHAPTLDNIRNAVVFFVGVVLLAPFLSSFLDAGFVKLIGWGQIGYWQLWQTRLISNILAMLTIVPVVLTLAKCDVQSLQSVDRYRWLEGGVLFSGLLAVGVLAFLHPAGSGASNAFIYLPVPFLLWAALRFGPAGTSVAFSIVAFLVIWGAGHGRGPFISNLPTENALSVQLFLISVAIPLLFLAAVMKERSVTERRLRASEQRFSTAFRSSPDAITISRNADGTIIDVNDRWQSLFGYPREEVVGRTFSQLGFYSSDHDRERMLSITAEQGVVRGLEVAFRTRPGTVLQTLISSDAVEIEGEVCSITIIHDITEQRRTERETREQLRQLTYLTRIATVNDLSGALAHELNQPLTAILSNAQAAQHILSRDPVDLAEIRNIVGDIVDADKRAGEVIGRLRSLMKKDEPQFVLVDVNEVLRDVLHFAHSDLITRNVAVTAGLAPHLPRVNGDPVQLQQLFLNLICNACEAMESVHRSERSLTVTSAAGYDGIVQIVVADQGPGLAADDVERIFEPFFTTKAHGVGLGLPICRTIATTHGGSLRAEINSGRGAAFRVILPGDARTRSAGRVRAEPLAGRA